MIGILCARKSLLNYTNYFLNKLPRFSHDNGLKILVFSLDDVDLLQQTVTGISLDPGYTENNTVPIPRLIINLTKQYSGRDIKKMRTLAEIPGIKVVNQVNRYNQLMLRDILQTGDTKKYLLPYREVDTNSMDQPSEAAAWLLESIENPAGLLLPEKGSRYKRLIYFWKSGDGYNIYHNNSFDRMKKAEAAAYLQSILRGRRWIKLDAPPLITTGCQVKVLRVNAVKGSSDEWEISDGHTLAVQTTEILSCISLFIPNLRLCYVNFIADEKGNQYFLSLGGWDIVNPQQADKQPWVCSLIKYVLDSTGDMEGETPDVDKN